MKIHFYLDHRQGKKESLAIFLQCWHRGELLRVFTGEHCDLENWDKQKERIRPKHDGAEEINEVLESMKQEVLKVVRKAKMIGEGLTVLDIKNKLSFIKDKEKDFFSVWDEFIDSESRVRGWSRGTISRFDVVRNHLLFLNGKRMVKLEALNKDFYKKFIDYQVQNDFRNSYIKRNLDILKWFLNWAAKKGFSVNNEFKNVKMPGFHRDEFRKSTLYLDAGELLQLFDLDVRDQELATSRDIFCFACLTEDC